MIRHASDIANAAAVVLGFEPYYRRAVSALLALDKQSAIRDSVAFECLRLYHLGRYDPKQQDALILDYTGRAKDHAEPDEREGRALYDVLGALVDKYESAGETLPDSLLPFTELVAAGDLTLPARKRGRPVNRWVHELRVRAVFNAGVAFELSPTDAICRVAADTYADESTIRASLTQSKAFRSI